MTLVVSTAGLTKPSAGISPLKSPHIQRSRKIQPLIDSPPLL
jgi:hypothetical protein